MRGMLAKQATMWKDGKKATVCENSAKKIPCVRRHRVRGDTVCEETPCASAKATVHRVRERCKSDLVRKVCEDTACENAAKATVCEELRPLARVLRKRPRARKRHAKPLKRNNIKSGCAWVTAQKSRNGYPCCYAATAPFCSVLTQDFHMDAFAAF